MSQFVTVDRKDSRYLSYLTGAFSKNERALALRNFHTATDKEEVTFQIVPVSEIEKPSFVVVWFRALRLQNVAFVLFPLLIAVSLATRAGFELSRDLVSFLILSVGSFQIGGNLLNDYFDHIRGVDRLHPLAGSRMIQKGWLAAISVFRTALFFVAFGAAIGVMILFQNPPLLVLLALMGALFFFGFYGGERSLRYRGGSEWIILFLLGPFLVEAYYFALTSEFSFQGLILGFCFGWWMLLYAHIKNFEHILQLSQAQVKNWVVELGFEKSKRLIQFWIFGFFILFSLAYYQAQQFFVLGLTVAGGLPLAAPVFKEIKNLKSCVGSGLRKMRLKTLTLFWMVLVSWGFALFLFGVSV